MADSKLYLFHYDVHFSFYTISLILPISVVGKSAAKFRVRCMVKGLKYYRS